MIKYEVIKKAKQGDSDSIARILNFYIPVIKKFSKEDEFIQLALIEVYKGILKFKNKKI